MYNDSRRKGTKADHKRHQESDVFGLRHLGELTLRLVESQHPLTLLEPGGQRWVLGFCAEPAGLRLSSTAFSL
jgi:hypothetical protein